MPPCVCIFDIGTTRPTNGEISFTNVSLRYRKEAQLALQDITFKIPPGASVGVVGRTSFAAPQRASVNHPCVCVCVCACVRARAHMCNCGVHVTAKDHHLMP